jgi:hypothetical protein
MRKHAGEIGAKICAKRSDKSNVKKNKFWWRVWSLKGRWFNTNKYIKILFSPMIFWEEISIQCSTIYSRIQIGIPVTTTDISQYRLRFGSSLLYTVRACSIWIAWQRSSPMKGELRLRGANSVSKFHHHNINGGAVDDTCRHRSTPFMLNLGMRYLW